MLSIGYENFDCDSRLVEQDGKTVSEPMKVVVGPIRVIEKIRAEETEHIVFSGCSAHFNCWNLNCLYSRGARDERKKTRESRPNW